VTEGETIEEAREMARNAIRGDLESLAKEGRAAPADIELAQEKHSEKRYPRGSKAIFFRTGLQTVVWTSFSTR